MSQSQIVNDRWPVQLRHPQRIADWLWRIGRAAFSVAYFAHRASRTAQGARDLAQTASFRQSSPDLLVPLHRHAPKRHAAVSFVVTHEGCGTQHQESGEEDLMRRQHAIDWRGQIIDRIGSP